ncbi:redoxin domain-containing protein [Dongia deserti]|uniref:redoxin domain-containing protein n=1 Tax=Dongia deserti TaxID=2268030 RepID=UPI0013C3E93B|nr:redoxin domain-containing protein [Dongia deserti]
MTVVAPESAADVPPVPPAVRLLDVGDAAPFVHAPDQDGKPVSTNADLVAGKPILLLFCPSLEQAAASLQGFRAAFDRLTALQATVFVISRDGTEANAEACRQLSLPFAILADTRAGIFKGYGVDPYPAAPAATLFILDAGHRVASMLDRMEPGALVPEAIATLDGLAAKRPATRLQSHPPVLVLPRMLSPIDCSFLARIWSRDVPEYSTDGFANAGTGVEGGDYKVVHDGIYGRAVEYIVQDQNLQRFIDARLRRRLLPEINKAFQAKGLKREGYRIAGYQARDGAFLHPHRDNSTPANAHRRFTMTINLNAGEYEGGELRFREYGEQLYAVERGTAIVWSASLLHEVLPVTKGRRLVLGVHMFGT